MRGMNWSSFSATGCDWPSWSTRCWISRASRPDACTPASSRSTCRHFTAELASVFRSAFDRAGLTFTVDCPPLDEPVYLDREMWEKVVLNLLSNALKFTFDGSITVRVRRRRTPAATVTVTDTGIGVPAAEMPQLFERFHRIESSRARSTEGSGIGLALVRELVGLHGGTITADSQEGAGTTFTVRLPFGTAHLPADELVAGAGDPRDLRRDRRPICAGSVALVAV